MTELSKRQFEQGNLVVTVRRIYDDHITPEQPDTRNYKGCTDEDIERYIQEDQDRYEEFYRDEWYYVGIVVQVSIAVDHMMPVIAESSVWGIESDSNEGYFAELEKDGIKEALHRVELLKGALNET